MSSPEGGSVGQKKAMDETYSFHRHIYDFTRKFYLFGRDRLIRRLAPPKGGSVLEVGCGTARNLIVAAKRWPEARFYGFDISERMLETAAKKVARKRLGGKITLAEGDAGAFDTQSLFGLAQVDRVFMSYTLSMIPPWQDAIALGAKCLAPGGSLHIIDFGQYERLPGLLKRVHFKSLNDFHVFPRRELPAVLKRIAEEQGLGMEFTPLYWDYAWSATLTKP
jgi:S-adenosylmethionine-diacylgycerolhomoserine-N-methlytransferase